MDSASQNSDALTSSLTLRKSDYQDVPVEQASTRFVTAQSTLQAALLSASRMLSTNLSDYLK
jgi:flagellin-like hook-associated protein FlgL